MRSNYETVRHRALHRYAILMFLLSLATQGFAATSYLEELNAEAASESDGATNTSAPASNADWNKQQTTGNHGKIDQGLSMEQFEKTLKSNFYGSYLFYSALSDAKQTVVYEEYKKNNDIEHLREVIQQQMTN